MKSTAHRREELSRTILNKDSHGDAHYKTKPARLYPCKRNGSFVSANFFSLSNDQNTLRALQFYKFAQLRYPMTSGEENIFYCL